MQRETHCRPLLSCWALKLTFTNFYSELATHPNSTPKFCWGIFSLSPHVPTSPRDNKLGFSCLAVPGGSGPLPTVSTSVEVTPLPASPLLPPAGAQRYLRRADPAAQGFHRPLRNVEMCVFPPPCCPGQRQPGQGAAGHRVPGRSAAHPEQGKGCGSQDADATPGHSHRNDGQRDRGLHPYSSWAPLQLHPCTSPTGKP